MGAVPTFTPPAIHYDHVGLIVKDTVSGDLCVLEAINPAVRLFTLKSRYAQPFLLRSLCHTTRGSCW